MIIELKNNIADINSESLTIKLLSFEELCVALKRLFKFNLPVDNYSRVQRDVIIKHCISPKLNLKNYTSYSLGAINKLFQAIWNKSVEKLIDYTPNYKINLYLAYELLKVYKSEECLKKLMFSKNNRYFLQPGDFQFTESVSTDEISNEFLKNVLIKSGVNPECRRFKVASPEDSLYLNYLQTYPLNLEGLIEFSKQKENLPYNIQRLLLISELVNEIDTQNFETLESDLEKVYRKVLELRKKKSLLRPFELVILTEGTTEETLLPVFSKIAGVDFFKNGIKVISAGGKNKVLKVYEKLISEIKIPIFIILDSDAVEVKKKLSKVLRKQDQVYLILQGEFEDILDNKLICRAVNRFYKLTGKIEVKEIENCEKKSHILQELWKEKGFGEFKKVEFAKIIAYEVKSTSDLSEELIEIFEVLKRMLVKK